MIDAERRREMLAPAIVLVLGLATILGAWGFELIGHFMPCKLCLEERVPYYVGLPVALTAFLAALAGAKPMVSRTLLLIAGLIFAYNIYLGGYHAGVEWNIFTGPSDCGSTGSSITTPEDLLKTLEGGIRIVPCDQASWRFLFLSFAGWNAVISIALTAIAMWGVFRPMGSDAARR